MEEIQIEELVTLLNFTQCLKLFLELILKAVPLQIFNLMNSPRRYPYKTFRVPVDTENISNKKNSNDIVDERFRNRAGATLGIICPMQAKYKNLCWTKSENQSAYNRDSCLRVFNRIANLGYCSSEVSDLTFSISLRKCSEFL